MSNFSTWRGFDLRLRIAKIERAFRREPIASAEEIPILVNTPCYFSFGSADKPEDYYTNPASMFKYQADGYERHLQHIQDDYVPYFMPWFGTGVLASGFGAQIRMPSDRADDPAVLEPLVHSPAEIARLKLPDPQSGGWMPRVLDTIDFAVQYGDLPVGLTDMQGPLDTVGQLCGQAQLYEWMHRAPQAVHDLFDLVTEAFIQWVKVQKQHIGEPLDWSNGLQGTFSPGCGVWESDDDLVLISAPLYEEFVAPRVERLFNAFGGGSLHYCGSGTRHLSTFENIPSLKVINNSPLGDFEAFAILMNRMAGLVTIQLQDGSPVEPETYYDHLFAAVDRLDGLMVVTFVFDNVGMDGKGGYVPVEWDPFVTANRVVQSVRSSIARRLAGELVPTKSLQTGATVPSGGEAAQQNKEQSDFSAQQLEALADVRRNLVAFDEAGIQSAVRAAIKLDIKPYDIILQGMAMAMQEVGDKFEQGEYFLPELVMAGATMKAGMQVLQPLLKAAVGADAISKGKVVLGTVKGDLHDIGKNLVRTMLEGAQYDVIDLGVDVTAEKFVEALQTHAAQILAMSALLTTTLRGMEQTMEALHAAGLRQEIKVMIGGAPVSQEYAVQIGADGYASTAVGAVHEADRLMGLG